VNLVLFEPPEVGQTLRPDDPRARHLLSVLRRRVGERFDAGVVDGPRGKGTVLAVTADGIAWSFAAEAAAPEPDAIALIVGLPRPQTARKILHEASALGVRALHFVATDKGEPNYRSSTLWTDGEWRRQVLAGVAQAFATRLPEVTHDLTLSTALDRAPGASLVALDNYEAARPLSAAPIAAPVTVVIGSERGWSTAERDLFRARGATLAHLGPRVLRTETACVAALAVVKSRLGLF
jgi:RsmE family RNA methyltransferase